MKPPRKVNRQRQAIRQPRGRSAAAPRCGAVSLVVALVLGGTALFTEPALASQGRVFGGTFGGEHSTIVDPYPLASSTCPPTVEGEQSCRKAIAADATTGRASSGDVYVGDPNNRRIEKFDADGHFILMFGEDVNKTKVEAGSSTEAERNVCTAASGDVCQRGTEGTGPGAFVDGTLAIAVDSTSGPSAGDVYVGNTIKAPDELIKGRGVGEGTVAKFDETGKLVTSWGGGGQLRTAGQPFGAIAGVTVDGSGDLWVYGATEEERFEDGRDIFVPRPLVFELLEAGSLLTSWRRSVPQSEGAEQSRGPQGIAIDAAHHVYLNVGDEVDKLEASDGHGIEFVSGTFLASDLGKHTIDVLGGPESSTEKILAFESSCPGGIGLHSCHPVETVTRSHPHLWGSLAVNYSVPDDTIYVEEEEREVAIEAFATVPTVTTLPAADVSTSSATLRGAVDPEGVKIEECFFEWGEGSGPYEHTAPCEQEVGAGNGSVPVDAQLPVQSGKSYHFRLVAANAQDVNEPVQGADVVLGPPRVDGAAVVEITAGSATFLAEVNPQSLDSRYRFEYLTEAQFRENGESFSGPHPATSVPLSDADLGSGHEDVSVSRHVTGLSPHTAYRYRVVAQNVLGEGADAVDSPAEALLTWNTGEFGLLDGRQWEMVSPPDKHGALVEPIGEDWLIQAAAGGGRLAYVTRAPTESNPAGYPLYQSVLATRGAAGGWSSHDLAVPHIAATGISVGEGWEYRFFSEDLSRAFVQPFGPFVSCKSEQGVAQPCLSPNATEQTPFVASDYAEGDSAQPCTASCYTPMVTGAEGYANVPAETAFGHLGYLGRTCPQELYCGPRFLYATPDASHAVFESWTPLTEPSSAKVRIPRDSLYEWSAGRSPSEQIRLVSVLPGNSTGEALPAELPRLGAKSQALHNSISNDGARAVFEASKEKAPVHLYLRENATQPQSPLGEHGECLVAADACTVQLDAGLSGTPIFQAANSSVTRIVFTDAPPENSRPEADLYEYNVEQGRLVSLTSAAHVVASVIGAGEDASWLYFTADGKLASGAVEGNCNAGAIVPTPGGECDLYAMHYGAGAWRPPILVAVLSSEDIPDWGKEAGELAELTAAVSPNGEWLTFSSSRSLTGFDNRDRASHEPDQQVYEFHASTGQLTCASCNAARSRPHGVTRQQINTGDGGKTGGFQREGGSSWIAATLPGRTPTIDVSTATYQSRYLSDTGRLFFDSSDALVPKDTNNTMDVYEYEPEGAGGERGCSRASENGGVTFKSAHNVQVEGRTVQEGAGCVGLISSGESANESAFLDATESGSEVFFLTSAKLLPQDVDTSYDVYDARECTTASPCLPAPVPQPPPCDNEASCRPAPTPQPGIFAASGSATFSGPGDLATPPAAPPPAPKLHRSPTRAQKLAAALRACKKQRSKKKRAACERTARKKYGASSAKTKKPTARKGHGR